MVHRITASEACVLLCLVVSTTACTRECPEGTTRMGDVCIRMEQTANRAAGSGVSAAGSSGTTNSSGINAAASSPSSKLQNGMRCASPDECEGGFCKNVQNGSGICCSARDDCCSTPSDCPDVYRHAAACTDVNLCRGVEVVALCEANLCSSRTTASDAACNGMKGPSCGLYRDITCKAGQNNTCPTSCSDARSCDDNAFCEDGQCVEKRSVGGTCTESSQCENGNCANGVCCTIGDECCSDESQCTAALEARCDEPDTCQGTRRETTCDKGRCRYGERIDDDRACVPETPNGGGCGLFRNAPCTGEVKQQCPPECGTLSNNLSCDPNTECRTLDGEKFECVPLGTTAGTGGSGSGGAGGGGT